MVQCCSWRARSHHFPRLTRALVCAMTLSRLEGVMMHVCSTIYGEPGDPPARLDIHAQPTRLWHRGSYGGLSAATRDAWLAALDQAYRLMRVDAGLQRCSEQSCSATCEMQQRYHRVD
eukprot:COSAG05_NODE_2663_length_2787_cov_2.329241_2_plen_118_part_00